MGFKISKLSFQNLPEINQVAELGVKTNVPLNNLTVCTKIAESLLHGFIRRNSVQRNFAAADFQPKLTAGWATESDQEN